MAQSSSGEKSEKPTPKRLKDARKKGQIPRSVDLVQYVVLFVVTYLIPLTISRMYAATSSVINAANQAAVTGDLDATLLTLKPVIPIAIIALTPLFGAVMLVTWFGLAVQGGVVLSGDPLRPKLERISIKQGFKRMFSMQPLVDTAKSLVRLVILSLLMTSLVVEVLERYANGTRSDVANSLPLLGGAVLKLIRLAAIAGITIGVADYAFQRHKIGKQLKMSKYDVKMEHKSNEGDPMVRARRKAAHQALNQNQMLNEVADAAVVMVNPTHVAVAIKYAGDGVPRLVAKGGDEFALKIRERALHAGVPVLEVRPLARFLHDNVDVGAEIPGTLYEAIAIVLAFVMRKPKAYFSDTIRQLSVPESRLSMARAAAASGDKDSGFSEKAQRQARSAQT